MNTPVDRCDLCGVVLDEDTMGSRPGICIVCETINDEVVPWEDDDLEWDDDPEWDDDEAWDDDEDEAWDDPDL